MSVFGYCRVSLVKQAEEGESLGVQQRQIEGYALQHGLTLDQVFVEKGVSGSIPLEKRPEGSNPDSPDGLVCMLLSAPDLITGPATYANG